MTARHVVVTIAAAVAIFAAGSAGAQVTCSWTDNPIVTGQTPIKAIHINEIRACIDRILGGSAPPPPPPPGQNITGTWEGTEDTFVLPYTWTFVITDNGGVLSGTYLEHSFGGSRGNIGGSRNGNHVVISLLDGFYSGGFVGTLGGGVITGEIEYQAADVSLGPYDLTLERVRSSGLTTDEAQLRQGRSGEFAELVKQCIGFSPAGGASGSSGELHQCSRSSEQEMIERYGPDWDQP